MLASTTKLDAFRDRVATIPAYEREECWAFGHTPETWAAIVACPAAVLAREIATLADELRAKVRAWEEAYSGEPDPGLDAIRAAGLQVPPHAQKHGTSMMMLDNDIHALRWVLDVAYQHLRDLVPEPVKAVTAAAPAVASEPTAA
jgi:hypothetical protein